MSTATATAKPSVLVPPEAYAELHRMREDFDTVLESIELANDPEVMASLQRAEADIEAGRVEDLDDFLAGRRRQKKAEK